MSAPNSVDAAFLAKAAEGRKAHLERLMGVLDEYLKDVLTDDKELLLEDMKGWIGKMQAQTEQKISEMRTYEELRSETGIQDMVRFVNDQTAGFQYMLREKENICSKIILKLLLGTDAEFDCVEGKTDQADFEIDLMQVLSLEEEQRLEEIRREKSALSEEIEQIVQEKEETENAFREAVRQNAETRSRMEAERPEIKYLTRKIRREGFFGFLIDLVGKMKTETVVDDSELLKWQERVDELQNEYDARIREINDQIEALKESWHEKEEVYDQLDASQRQLEKQFRERLKMAYLEKLEEYLHGEGGLSDRIAVGVERDLSLNAEKIRDRIWEEYQKRI